MTKQEIIREIQRTAEENGGIPLGIEKFRQVTGITRSDWYGKHWARWGDALIEAGFSPNKLQGALSDERGNLDEVIEICQPIARAGFHSKKRTTVDQEEFGFVYLMKSGRFYKIGRSASVGRREYELSIQLPEKVKKIH